MTFTIESFLHSIRILTDRSRMAVRIMLSRAPSWQRFAGRATSTSEERVLKQITETQQIALSLGGPEELRKFLAEQMRIWGPVARENNINGEG